MSHSRLRKYQAAAEEFFIDSYGNIQFINEAMLKILPKHKKNSLEHVAGYMWWSAIDEMWTIFGDFATEQHAAVLLKHQRSYYDAIRFCMEAVSDLEYLCKNPRELSSFITDGDEIEQELKRIKKTCVSKKN